jgi:predicted amidohydrolase YtcJ
VDAARGAFWEGHTGTLTPGKAADLVILDQDPFTLVTPGARAASGGRAGADPRGAVDPAALETLPLQATVVGGRVGWSAGALLDAEPIDS